MTIKILLNKLISYLIWPVLYTKSFINTELEKNEIKRFKKNKYDVVFYCERPFQYTFISSTIDNLKSKLNVALIANTISDKKDGKWNRSIIDIDFYEMRKFCLPRLSMNIFVTPETVSYSSQLPRAIYQVHFAHSSLSLHMVYPENKFFNFNVMFATGDHHVDEFNKIHNNNSSKLAFKTGLGRIDYLKYEFANYNRFRESKTGKKTVLIAPSWHDNNITEVIGAELTEELLNNGYKVIYRPHYKIAELKPSFLDNLKFKFKENENFTIDIAGNDNTSLFESDIMICDYSGVAFEYAFVTENPVLFLNIPPKIRNKNWKKLGLEPIEIKLRNKIGRVVECDTTSVMITLEDTLKNYAEIKKSIKSTRLDYCYNFDNSVGKVASNEIIKLHKSINSSNE